MLFFWAKNPWKMRYTPDNCRYMTWNTGVGRWVSFWRPASSHMRVFEGAFLSYFPRPKGREPMCSHKFSKSPRVAMEMMVERGRGSIWVETHLITVLYLYIQILYLFRWRVNGHDSETTQSLVYHVSTLPLLMDDLPSLLGATNSLNKMVPGAPMANTHTHDWWHFGMGYIQLYTGIKHTTSSIRSSFQWTDFLIFHFSTIHLPEILIFLIAANLFSDPAYLFVVIFLKLMFKRHTSYSKSYLLPLTTFRYSTGLEIGYQVVEVDSNDKEEMCSRARAMPKRRFGFKDVFRWAVDCWWTCITLKMKNVILCYQWLSGCFRKWWYPHFTPQNDNF